MQQEIELLQEAVSEKYEPLEFRACQIALLYEKLRREFFKEPYTCLNRSRDKRKSKCFPHFYKLAKIEAENRDILPDMSLYLRAQFEMVRLKAGSSLNDTPVTPQQLHLRSAFQRYRDYILQLIPKENLTKPNPGTLSPRTIIRSLGKTATLLTKLHIDLFDSPDINWWKLMTYTNEGDSHSIFLLFIMQNLISPYFLAVSKTYQKWVETLDINKQLELPTSLEERKLEIVRHPKVVDFAKQIFPNELDL